MMNPIKNNEVSLEEMLFAREQRVMIQNTLIQTYHVPLICFTLNIPGPIKVFEKIPETFQSGCEQIEHILERSGTSFFYAQSIEEKTGYEAFFCADGSPEELKKMMIQLEDKSAVGRLYDIDVLQNDGLKVSREELGLPARTCLLCSESAHSCSRSRRHSTEELIARIKEILAKS
ncbi:MAG: citrate lyase holo-[acyl-carrier protein] synthase [Clostridium sp.]